MKRFSIIAFSVVVVAVVFFSLTSVGAADRSKAVQIELETLSGGKELSLASFKGKPLFVVFWASWCPGCRQLLPQIPTMLSPYQDGEVEVVAISVDDDASDAARYLKREGLSFAHTLHDPGWRVARGFGVRSIPTYVILGRKGEEKIRNPRRYSELQEAIDAELPQNSDKLSRLLAESSTIQP